ncbi:ribonuclease H-like domain, reverse transcriptase, RNA-dependent DNA polymerase [Tanacetum coccineum]
MLVQVCVDDIIFGSTKRSWCDEFEALMKSRFQMSSMGELTYFLGLQVKQKEDGIFISQDKYVAEILKKFDFANVKTASTPIETQNPLTKDEEAADVDLLSYKGSTDPKHLGPTSGIRATRGTLSKKNHKNNKHSLSRSRKMSHPADEFSQHLSDDDVSNHEDASDNGDATNKPKQQLISTATTISNIKLPILKKEEYDIWAMEMEHYLEYIDNDVWKVIQNGNSKKRISTGKDGVIRVLPPVSAAEIHAVEKERKARTILLMAIPKEI